MGAPKDNSSSLRLTGGALRLIGWSAAVTLAFAVSVGLGWAHSQQIRSQGILLQQSNALGPRVLVMGVQQPGRGRHVSFPASIHGYIETPIYAKTAGYLKAIYVDKGDRVYKGEVLALLNSPELDKQVADARANYWLQKVTDTRYQALVAQQVVPQQTADNSHAALLQARAAYEQLLALQSYEVIHAETDGIVTARDVDPGALIPQVTSPGSSTPIVDLATLYPLRVYADVPQDLASFVKDGDLASVSVTQYPGRNFLGTVTRHPEALAQDTRTMRVEVDLPNKDRALYPGMYATLTLNVSSSDNAPRIPDDALIFRQGTAYVPLVKQDHIHLAKVILGDDNGQSVEIAHGISVGSLIALNVGEGVEEGDPVQPVISDGLAN
jgi:membrane fusion protein, multidrug efflux system